MNAVNLGNNTAENEQLEHINPTTHGYNLQPRPVKPRERYNLLQIAQQSTYRGCTNTHTHVHMTQMSVKAGIEKYSQKGNKVLMKGLRQLHDRQCYQKERTSVLVRTDRGHLDI